MKIGEWANSRLHQVITHTCLGHGQQFKKFHPDLIQQHKEMAWLQILSPCMCTWDF